MALTNSLTIFGIPLIVLGVTGDPLAAGIVSAIGTIVRLFALLIGGVWADRYSRSTLLILGGVTGCVIAATFVLLIFLDLLNFAVLIVIEIGLSLRNGLLGVASEAALKDVVPTAWMGRAQGANQARDASVSLIGSPLGGLLLGIGSWLLGVVMLACQMVAVITGWMLRSVLGTRQDRIRHRGAEERPSRGTWSELKEGVGWVTGRRDLRGVVMMILLANVGLGTLSTTLIYSLQTGGTSTFHIGLVSGTAGAAMLVGSLVVHPIISRFGAGRIASACLLVMVVSTCLMIVTPSTAARAVLLGIAVFLVPVTNAALNGYFMVATPSDRVGRASSAATVLVSGALPLSPLLAGMSVRYLDPQLVFLVPGALCLLSMAVGIMSSQIRSLPVEADWEAHAKSADVRNGL